VIPDPLAELHPWESPYEYAGGNPINRIDPFGLTWRPVYDDKGNYQYTYWDEPIVVEAEREDWFADYDASQGSPPGNDDKTPITRKLMNATLALYGAAGGTWVPGGLYTDLMTGKLIAGGDGLLYNGRTIGKLNPLVLEKILKYGSPQAKQALRQWLRSAKAAGRLGLYGSIALSALDIALAQNAGERVIAAGGLVGGITGGSLGALGGSALLPGGGTIIGGAVGGYTGALGGEKFAEMLFYFWSTRR